MGCKSVFSTRYSKVDNTTKMRECRNIQVIDWLIGELIDSLTD